ncbi:MAG: hypothetical protein M3P30_08075 [Chloroflexota bacterium]|nr:hypothetical protein [Chloroflexota bacterium]
MVNNIVLSGMAWVSSMKSSMASRISEERGQDLIEYAVLAGAIGIAAFVAIGAVGFPAVFTSFGNHIKNCIDLDSSSVCG